MNIKNLTLYSLLCIIWGATWYIIKLGLNGGTPPLFGAGLRFLIAGIILLALVKIQKKSIPFSLDAIKIYLLFGLLNFSLSYGLTYWATQYIYSNMSAILWAGFPFTVALMAHFLLPDDKINLSKAFSITMGTIGIIFIMWEGTNIGESKAMIGVMAILFAVTISAYPNVYLKMKKGVVTSLQLNTVSQLIAGFVLILSTYIFESDMKMVWSTSNIVIILILAVFGSVISWLIYYYLFNFFQVSQFAYVAFIPPVIATFIGWSFLGESLTLRGLVGAGFVAIGALTINLLQKKKPI